jgi:hypothetical protein
MVILIRLLSTSVKHAVLAVTDKHICFFFFTFFAIATAREQGYESVAHLLMDRLKRQAF